MYYSRGNKGFRGAKASVGSDLRHDMEPTVIKGCSHGRFGKATVSPPPSCYQLFSVEARAKSLCVKSMSVDCDRVGRREAEPGWYLCGGGRVHRGESEDVCVGGCECVYTLLGITSVGYKYMEGRSGILCVKS